MGFRKWAGPGGFVGNRSEAVDEATDGEHVQELEEGRPYLDALKTHFGIELGVPYEAIRPLPE